jgi:hypothetical protein
MNVQLTSFAKPAKVKECGHFTAETSKWQMEVRGVRHVALRHPRNVYLHVQCGWRPATVRCTANGSGYPFFIIERVLLVAKRFMSDDALTSEAGEQGPGPRPETTQWRSPAHPISSAMQYLVPWCQWLPWCAPEAQP